jgi:predicted membrane protein
MKKELKGNMRETGEKKKKKKKKKKESVCRKGKTGEHRKMKEEEKQRRKDFLEEIMMVEDSRNFESIQVQKNCFEVRFSLEAVVDKTSTNIKSARLSGRSRSLRESQKIVRPMFQNVTQ